MVTRLRKLSPPGLLVTCAAVLALAGCQMPPPRQGPGTPIVHLGLMPTDPAPCLGPVRSVSNAPVLRDARLAASNGEAKLTGCILNPGPLDYRAIIVEISFFDSEGHLLSSLTRDSVDLPAYAAIPAKPAGAPRWLIPIDVEADPNAVQAEVVVHALVCAGIGVRGCTEEHDTAVVAVSAAKT